MCFSVALHMIHVKSLSFVLFYISSFLCHPLFSQNLKFKTYQVEQGISNNSVNAMANDPSGGIWIGTWDGLNFFDGKKFKVYGHQLGNPNSLAGNYINDIKLDKLNRLWVWADSEAISLKSEQEGFTNFHLVEGAQIDTGGHQNDAKKVVEEVIDFDQAVAVVLEFADKNPGTLVVITADHETGGLTLPQGNISKKQIELEFSTDDHTGIMVPLFAYGPHADEFRGVYENTEIYTKIMAIVMRYHGK